MLDGSGKDLNFSVSGRFPANVILSEESAKILFEQTGIRRSGGKV
jgi:hypothetical protein